MSEPRGHAVSAQLLQLHFRGGAEVDQPWQFLWAVCLFLALHFSWHWWTQPIRRPTFPLEIKQGSVGFHLEGLFYSLQS